MASFDWNDFGGRIVALWPRRWQGASALDISSPTKGRLGALLYGLSGGQQTAPSGLPFVYSQLQYAKAQCRFATMTDDQAANQAGLDFFGGVVPRVPGESVTAYASRLVLTLTAGCPSIPGLQKILQAYMNALLMGPKALASLGGDATGAADTVGAADVVLPPTTAPVQPFGADNAGSADNYGFADEAGPTLSAPAVYVFDDTSDPALSAAQGVVDPHFGIALIYPGIASNLLRAGTPYTQQFATMVAAFKAPGTIPVYLTNGPN